MAEEVFIDAGFWIALISRRQEHYHEARRLWESAISNRWFRITTNWTLYEALTYLNSTAGRHDLALELLALVDRTKVDVVRVSNGWEEEALNVFTSHSDKSWSVVDCANFICIKERQSNWAFSFDGDFAQAQTEFGFTHLGHNQ